MKKNLMSARTIWNGHFPNYSWRKQSLPQHQGNRSFFIETWNSNAITYNDITANELNTAIPKTKDKNKLGSKVLPSVISADSPNANSVYGLCVKCGQAFWID